MKQISDISAFAGNLPARPQLTLSRPLVIVFILMIILPWFLVGWIFFSVMKEGVNFFNEVPDNRFGTGTDLTALTINEYKQIQSPTEFGDIILFINPKKGLIHSCVYIADDIVFTKNGVGFGTPFVFEQLGNVMHSASA